LVVLGNTPDVVAIQQVVLLLDGEETFNLAWSGAVPAGAVLMRLVPDDKLWHNDLAPVPALRHHRGFPNLLIGETTARRLLAEAGLDLDELWAEMGTGRRIELKTGLRVRVETELDYEQVSAVNVVGYYPSADRTTEGERILVAANYSGPLPQNGVIYPGADENGSGVAVMLEVARLWHDLDFQPKRTVVFAALDAGGGEHFPPSRSPCRTLGRWYHSRDWERASQLWPVWRQERGWPAPLTSPHVALGCARGNWTSGAFSSPATAPAERIEPTLG